MLKIVALALPYSKFTFERALAGIQAAGYTEVGFGLPHADGAYPMEPSPAEAERIRPILDRYGLRTGILYGASTERADADELCRWVDFAAVLGCRHLVWLGVQGYRRFPTELREPQEYEALHRHFVEKMQRVGAYAAERDVVITLKPHTGNTATGPILRKTLQEIGSPAVKACLDPGNVAYYEGLDPVADVDEVLDQAEVLIMKDHRGPRLNVDFPVPGEGEVDFGAILCKLHSAGFSGPLVVERVDGNLGQTLSVEEIDARMRTAYNNTRNLALMAGFALDS